MKDKVPALTGIRGFAASWVVVFHLKSLLEQLDILPAVALSRVVGYGYLAVDLFFLLSGFILARAYADRPRTMAGLRGFYLNRVFRIMPLNTVCLFAMLALVAAVGQGYWTTMPLGVGSFVAALFLVQSWGTGSATTWNLPAWSLSAEWLAYVIFPLAVLGIATIRSRGLAAAGCLTSLALLVVVMVTRGDATLDHTWLLGLPRCLLQFVAGMLLWRWLDLGLALGPSLRAGDAWLAGGAVLLSVAIAVPALELAAPFAFGALIVACAAGGRWTDALFGNRVAAFVGENSFSLYLVHFILVGCFAYLAQALSLGQAPAPARIAYAAVALACIYVVAAATWRFVELPGQAAGRRATRRWSS